MAAEDAPRVGWRVLDRYELVHRIGSGGMGTVWQARDHALDQVVALKHVRFGSDPVEGERSRRRTLREARAAAQLRGHPHVIAVYDVQEVDGDVWLVLEHLPSRSLAEVTAAGESVDGAEAARIGAAVADALAAAHDRGIIHRDVKPGNVLLSSDGRQVKLTDFGISHRAGEPTITELNAVSGTPAFMAREVARGEPETPASDVFSLGSTLYAAVEGRAPFGNDPHPLRMLARVANGQIDPPRTAGTFGPVLMHLLELDPNTRPDAAQAHRILTEWMRRAHDPTRPSDIAIAGSEPTPPADLAPSAGQDGAVAAAAQPTIVPGGALPGNGPAGERGWVRWLMLGAATAFVIAAVAGTGLALRDLSRDPAEMPGSVREVARAGNARDADPCALLDRKVMDRFGTPSRIGPGDDTGACRLTNPAGPADPAPLLTEAYYTNDTVEDSSGVDRQELGGLTVIRVGMTSRGCVTRLRFPDGDHVSVVTRNESAPEQDGPRACAANGTAAAVAVNRLGSEGVTYRPGWQGNVELASRNACEIVGAVLPPVPGLDADIRTGPPSGASCEIGSEDSTIARVTLGLMSEGALGPTFGTQSTVDGKEAHELRRPGALWPDNCEVSLVQRPSSGIASGHPLEYIDIAVEGPRPTPELCGAARRLATLAGRNAG